MTGLFLLSISVFIFLHYSFYFARESGCEVL